MSDESILIYSAVVKIHRNIVGPHPLKTAIDPKLQKLKKKKKEKKKKKNIFSPPHHV